MTDLLFSGSIGLLGAYIYQKCTKTYKQEHNLEYIKAIIIMIAMQLILYAASCFADYEPCPYCLPMSATDSHWYFDRYNETYAETEVLHATIAEIRERHKYDTDDLFVSTSTGIILSSPIKKRKAKLLAIALTVCADYFKEKYYCHRALKRYLESYHYQVFMMNKYYDQLDKNYKMCPTCAGKYDCENYYDCMINYLELWKSWWEEVDRKANYGHGCWHTYKNTYKLQDHQCEFYY